MKKLTIILICSLTLFAGGCKKFLEEDLRGKVLGNAVLASEPGLESALTGSYKGLANTWGDGFISGGPSDGAFGADDITTPVTSAVQNEFETLNISTASGGSSPTYQGCYKTIQGANNVIENYTNTKGDLAKIKIMAGEAYFLRAFAYYWMVRYYKNVPILTTATFSFDLLHVKRSTPQEVYKLIETDLGMAETLLANSKRAQGRPNIGSAKALLADVYLTQAGWPVKDNTKYALAAAKAKEVIDNKAIYGFDLVPSFATLFENDPAKIGSSELLKEEIFSVTTNKANGSSANCLLGAYYMPAEIGGWDVGYAELNFFNNFPAGVRKDATFAYTYKKSDGTVLTWQQLNKKHPY
ncbi:MAG: RagB/SusD family nutrient uptake outer membrane protein, partial [Ferruginibacter sp.]